MVEGAGAAATTAALKIKERLAGKNVVSVMSGGNLDTVTLSRIFQENGSK
jgi:threonine dehydratase